jgi:DNA-binding transcriptional regulator YdaS (Cro superfamily)
MDASEQALARVFEQPGMRAKIARALDITEQAVGQWTRVPVARVFKVSEITGVPPHELRPDVVPAPGQREAECA